MKTYSEVSGENGSRYDHSMEQLPKRVLVDVSFLNLYRVAFRGMKNYCGGHGKAKCGIYIFFLSKKEGGPQIKPSDKFKNNVCFGFCFFCLFCFGGVEVVCLS